MAWKLAGRTGDSGPRSSPVQWLGRNRRGTVRGRWGGAAPPASESRANGRWRRRRLEGGARGRAERGWAAAAGLSEAAVPPPPVRPPPPPPPLPGAWLRWLVGPGGVWRRRRRAKGQKWAGECRRRPSEPTRAALGHRHLASPGALRGRPTPGPAALGHGQARAPLAPLWAQSAGGGVRPGGPAGRALGAGSPARSACAARPLCPPALPGVGAGWGAGVGRVHPLPAPKAPWSPLRPPRDGGSRCRNARPLGAHRVGPGSVPLAPVGSALRAAGSRTRFLPLSSLLPVVTPPPGPGLCGFRVPLFTPQAPAGVPGTSRPPPPASPRFSPSLSSYKNGR